MPANVDTMFSVRQVPWHKLGKILQNPPTSAEAIKEAGLDWEVELKDIYFKDIANTSSPSPNIITIDTYYAVPNRKALVRTSDNEPLSIVSGTYKPLQNREAFEWFDTFVSDGLATYETAGSLLGGKKIWVLAKLKDDMEIVAGDNIRRYVLLCNGHDGVTSIMIQPTPIRVVCENTLNLSLGTGLVSGIWHQGDIKTKMERVKRLMGLAEQQFEKSKEIYKGMAKFPVNHTTIGTYVTTLIPDANKDATDRIKARVQASQERIWELHECGLGSNIPCVKGTMWGLYNAAIEFADYDLPRKARDLGNYQLFGQGAQFKKRALDLAMETANI